MLPGWQKSIILAVTMLVWFTSMVLAATIGSLIAAGL